jgi:hypothetical protein
MHHESIAVGGHIDLVGAWKRVGWRRRRIHDSPGAAL